EIGSHGATCNVVLPSVIDTPANRAAMPKADPAKWVQPSAIAALIHWLASPAAADINGAVIPIYGQS
ncbi:MAG: SDR family oxidoreductase, partial [Terriglobales bacterium]